MLIDDDLARGWCSRVALLGVVALGAQVGAARAALAASAPAGDGIALVPIDLSAGTNVRREDLESAVMKGLAVSGRPVVPPQDAAERAARGNAELSCDSAPCWSKLGAL